MSFKLRFSTRTLLLMLTLVAIGIGVWLARGRWLVSSLIDNGNHKPSWHSLLDYNGLDPETSHLRGQPEGVWRVTDSRDSIVWVMTELKTLTAISPDGAVKDLGCVICSGKPTPLWTGTIPDGRSGIILVSKESSTDAENYLMFVDFEGRSRVRQIVEINTETFRADVTEFDGWPVVKLASKDDAITDHVSFPECTLPIVTTRSDVTAPWELIPFH
jgi:hypothetical protein